MASKEFEIPNSTVALLLVLTIVFMVWSFAVISSSLTNPTAAPVTNEGPQSGSVGFRLGPAPVVDNPVQQSTARLEIVNPGDAQ